MNSRLAGIILGVASAGLIVVSIFGNQWMRADFDGARVSIGLYNASVCDEVDCTVARLEECKKPARDATSTDDPDEYMFALMSAPRHCQALIGGSMLAKMLRAARMSSSPEEIKRRLEKSSTLELGSFLVFAKMTYILGLIATPLLCLCAFLGATRKYLHLPIQPTTLLLFSVILLFITGPVTVALNPFTGLGVGLGFWLFGAGATGALISGIMLGRLRPPDDPFWDTADLDGAAESG